jgi:hypothetical protein
MPWSNSRPRSNDYGAAHSKARKQWAAQHDERDPCTRCGRALGPMGPWLHLDHSPDRSHYLGFAHGTCNRKAGAQVGRARQNAVQSRPW